MEPYDTQLRKLREPCVNDRAVGLALGPALGRGPLFLVRNQADMEKHLACLSKEHLSMQTWFRMNLKKWKLKVKPAGKPAEVVISEEDTLLFADVMRAPETPVQKAAKQQTSRNVEV